MSGQLERAIVNAHNAGDFVAAKRLGALLKQEEAAAGNNMQVQQGGQYQSPLPSPYANQAAAPQAKDGAFEGFGDAFYRGIDQPLENMGTTAEALGYDKTAAALSNATQAPPGQSPSAQFMNEGGESFDYKYLPKAAVEQSGQFIGSLAARAAGAGVGSVAGPVGAIVGGFAGPMLFEAAQQLGPIALERAKNNGRDKPNASDWEYATGTSAGIGALNALAPGATGKLKRMLIEGITEGTQSVGEQVGTTVNTDKGLEVSARQALGEGIIGGSSAGIVDTSLGTIGAATNLVSGSSSKPTTERQRQAQADFAQRLAQKVDESQNADGPAYNLTDVDPDSKSGAKAVIDSSHSDMARRLKTLVTLLKSRLKPENSDTLDVVLQKSDAAVAAVKAKNKVKSVVDAGDFNSFEELVGDTAEGQEAINLMHEMNELTRVYSDGLTGGISRYTDAVSPAGALDNYSNTGGVMQNYARPLATAALAATNPGLAAAQVGTFAAGRAIDKLTGRRSRVARYVDANSRMPGQSAPSAPSLRNQEVAEQQEELAQAEALQAQQEAQAQEEANLNEYVYNQGGLPNDQSPAGTMSSVLGIDPEQMMTMLDEIIATEPNPQIVDAAIAAQGSIVRGGRVPNLNQLISMMKLRVNPDPQFWIERDRSAGQAAAQDNLSRQEQNYQRGIENNQAFNQELQNAVDDDGSIPPLNKAYLKSALADLARDLGAQPLDMVNSIIERAVEKGVTQEQMQSYLAPYLERVQQQQEAKNSRDQAAAEVDADPINENKTPVLQLIDGMTDKSIAGETLAEKAQKLRQEYEANPNSKTAKQAYLNARKERDAAGDFGQESTYDYRVQHQAPVSEDDASIHDLEKAMPDFYKRPRDYKTGSKLDSATLQILQQLKGAPEQIVKVYRAVPKDAPDSINYGDWVTVNKQYAEDHGAGMPDGYKIIQGAAPAKNIKTNGDSIHEFGYAQSKVGLVPIHHSTNNTFDDFDLDKSADRSIWFSDNLAEVEGGYDGASGSAIVVTRYIDETKLALANRGQEDKLTHTELQQMGYDGVKYVDEKDTVYQIYYPEKLEKQDVVNRAIKPGTGVLSSAVSDYFKQPTPAQIKEQVEPAEQIAKFVLGKPGTEFENGISTYDDLVDLANMLDVSVKIVSASKMQDEGSMGQMQALLEGTAGEIKIQSVKKLGPLQFMKTLAHEVSHALEGLSLDRLRSESVYKYNAHPEARGSQDVMRDSSLRSRLNEVVEFAFAKPGMFFQKKHDSTPSAEVSKKIVAEIDELQKGTMVGFADKPELGQQPMRETFPQFTQSMLGLNVPLPENASATQIAVIEAEIAKMPSGGVAEQIAKQFVEYHDYIKETAEFGVDPLHFYLMDPKGMKKMMPETFKFMRDIFNKSSMPIEMHANPMMTVIALLLAGFGKALSGEEEEERPQGVLTPQPALLTT